MIKYATEEQVLANKKLLEEILNRLEDGGMPDEDVDINSISKKLCGTKEVMVMLNLTSQTRIYQLIKEGKLKKINKSGRNMYRVIDVMRYMNGKS